MSWRGSDREKGGTNEVTEQRERLGKWRHREEAAEGGSCTERKN